MMTAMRQADRFLATKYSSHGRRYFHKLDIPHILDQDAQFSIARAYLLASYQTESPEMDFLLFHLTQVSAGQIAVLKLPNLAVHSIISLSVVISWSVEALNSLEDLGVRCVFLRKLQLKDYKYDPERERFLVEWPYMHPPKHL